MRSVLFFVLLSLLVAKTTTAGDIHLPSNTPATGSLNNFPFNPTYGPEWRYQMVFTPNMLGNQPLSIMDIAFAPYRTGTHTSQDFEVRMSHAKLPPSNRFATNLPNPKTVLSAKTHVWNTTQKMWSPLGLTSTFTYNGVDNLTIEVRYRNGVTSGFSGLCYYANNGHTRIYAFGNSAYTAGGGNVDAKGMKIRITTADANIVLSGTPRPGGTVDLDLDTPSAAGKRYQLASSLGLGPIVLGSRRLGLTPDGLMDITVNNQLPAVFRNYAGLLDANGKAKASILIPNFPFLRGVRIHSAYVVLDSGAPFGILLISPTASFSIT